MRSRIFDFLIASSSHRNGLDHSFDHLQSWTTWKQCLQEHPKASFLDSKAPKSLVNQGKNRCRFVWDVDAAGSNPVTPTKKARERTSLSLAFLIDVSIWSCFAKQNAGSHSPLADRQARLSDGERGNHVAKRSYPVTPTRKSLWSSTPHRDFSIECYKVAKKTSDGIDYEITIDGKNGYATVAMTKYYDGTEEPTLPINLGTHSIYFYAE